MSRFEKPVSPDGNPYIIKPPGGSLYLVRKPTGVYGWVDGGLVVSELMRQWPGLDLWVETQKGRRHMNVTEAFHQYGYVSDELIFTWSHGVLEEFVVDEKERTSVRLECGRRTEIRAEYSQECDDWLHVIGGRKVDSLKDWISQIRKLDEPIAALYLMGEPGFGKDMFVGACSRLFGDQIADYGEVVLGNFNEKLQHTPVIFLNEAAPARQDGSRCFRTAIGARRFPFSQKYKPSSTIMVSIRLIIAANNADALRLSEENLEEHDEQAVAERILFIRVQNGARNWIRERGGLRYTADWVDDPVTGEPGRLARHFQWLVENHTVVNPGIRMLIDGDYSEWKSLSHKRSGLPEDIKGAVSMALCGVLGIPGAEAPCMADPERRGAWVSANKLNQHWGKLTGKKNQPGYSRIGRELRKMTDSKSDNVRWVNGSQIRAFFVPAELLYLSARETGFDQIDLLAERLGIEPGAELLDGQGDDVIH